MYKRVAVSSKCRYVRHEFRSEKAKKSDSVVPSMPTTAPESLKTQLTYVQTRSSELKAQVCKARISREKSEKK